MSTENGKKQNFTKLYQWKKQQPKIQFVWNSEMNIDLKRNYEEIDFEF